MRLHKLSLPLFAVLALAPSTPAQHSQVSAVAVDPTNPLSVWVTNRDNNSVSVVDVATGTTTHEIDVGRKPRTLVFSDDGTKVFVTNQRGNVPFDVSFISPFTGSEVRGSVSVIDVATKTVTNTLTDVGVEPYGIALAPNGKYFVVGGQRSGTLTFYDANTLAKLHTHQFLNNLSFIPAPFTAFHVDEDQDGIPDLGEPRGFSIRNGSIRIYTTHKRSSYVSIVDVVLDVNGLPVTSLLAGKIDTNDYPFHPIFNPVPVQTLQSQGVPRFLEDIALSPDGTRALVPHLLHNVNHDVNHTFPGSPGDFANRVYPALTMIDTVANTFDPGVDNSNRLHNELDASLDPGEHWMVGDPKDTGTGLAIAGGIGNVIKGGKLRIAVSGVQPGQTASVLVGRPTSIPMGSAGTKLVNPRFVFPVNPVTGYANWNIPNKNFLVGVVARAQGVIFDSGGTLLHYTNAVEFQIGAEEYGQNNMGRRAGHPAFVRYNSTGDRALMLNRGSEDVFLYDVAGSDMTLRSVFPPRADAAWVERAALDTSTPLGDLPQGLALVDDATTDNNDSLVYIVNELTRTLSVLRVDWDTRSIFQETPQIPLLLGPDKFDVSVRIGNELFEDASRAQTTGAPGTVGEFNNSCASCHFEGGEDGNVWQRPAGPRSTMPVYGGTLATGLILWKGVRLNMGETGPMFGGENGGHGVLTDAEQQGLNDYHETISVPLNPNFDPGTGQLTPQAAFGKDLFFGENFTGMNTGGGPQMDQPRIAGCAECHPRDDGGATRAFTADFIDPDLSGGNVETVDPFCFELQGNIVTLNVRNVNSGVDIDFDFDGSPDLDRNADGFRDIETYVPMNPDAPDPFQRDDANSYMCPIDPQDPQSPLKTFQRDMRSFSIPTKLGVFATGPYFHDHSATSLRMIVDPEAQAVDFVYGQPAYLGAPSPKDFPGLNKFFNEFHDIRGHEDNVPGASKVQVNLQSTNVQADIEAILAFIESL